MKSTLQLLRYITVTAILIAALVNPSLAMMVTVVTLICLILVGIYNTVRANQSNRMFWFFFVLVSISYLLAAHIPDERGYSPRLYGSEVTTKFLKAIFYSPHIVLKNVEQDLEEMEGVGGREFQGGGFVGGDGKVLPARPAEFGEMLPEDFTKIMERLSEIMMRPPAGFRNFMRIGHFSIALLGGWISGHLACLVRSSQGVRRRR